MRIPTQTCLTVPDFSTIAQSGIYLLYDGDELVYIGQAVNMRSRVASHIGEGVKKFDSVRIIPCAVHQLFHKEQKLIAQYAPKYNRCFKARSTQGLRDQGTHVPCWETNLTRDQAEALLAVTGEQFDELTQQRVKVRRYRKTRSKEMAYAVDVA